MFWPTVGYGYDWQIRQDGGYEAVGAYGQSVTIYPKEHLVIAGNSARVDRRGMALCDGIKKGAAGRVVISPGLPFALRPLQALP
jgi:CubicO group peptidase (beta-lactamase class C family)